MSETDYPKERLEDQIDYYNNSSKRNQRKYKYLKLAEIVCAASIPVGIGLAELVGNVPFWPAALRGLSAALGALVAVVSGAMAAYKYQENWLAHRTTCEMLTHEKYFYETGCGPYQGAEDRLSLLVNRVEELISQENTNWHKYMDEQSKGKGKTSS